MDEIRVNNEVNIETSNNEILKGIVLAVQYDRVAIRINAQYLDIAKKIKELDELKITADTHFGIKIMHSCTIDVLNSNNRIVVENNPAQSHAQNREHVRVRCGFSFLVENNSRIINAVSNNISAGGISFNSSEKFNLDDEVIIKLPSEIFEISCSINAKIIKINDDNYIAQFNNINETCESRIMKYVFKNVSKSSTGC